VGGVLYARTGVLSSVTCRFPYTLRRAPRPLGAGRPAVPQKHFRRGSRGAGTAAE
jgi:hypothetical protein